MTRRCSQLRSSSQKSPFGFLDLVLPALDLSLKFAEDFLIPGKGLLTLFDLLLDLFRRWASNEIPGLDTFQRVERLSNRFCAQPDGFSRVPYSGTVHHLGSYIFLAFTFIDRLAHENRDDLIRSPPRQSFFCDDGSCQIGRLGPERGR